MRERAGEPVSHDVALHAELADGWLDVEGRASQHGSSPASKAAWSELALTKIPAAAGALPVRVDAGHGTGALEVQAALAPEQGVPGVQVKGSVPLRGTFGSRTPAATSASASRRSRWRPTRSAYRSRRKRAETPPLVVPLPRAALRAPDVRGAPRAA